MNIICDDETLVAFRLVAQASPLLPILEWVVAQAKERGLWDYTCISVVYVNDNPAELGELLGDNPFDVQWVWRRDHVVAVEWGVTAGNDGFAHIVLAEQGGELASWNPGSLQI